MDSGRSQPGVRGARRAALALLAVASLAACGANAVDAASADGSGDAPRPAAGGAEPSGATAVGSAPVSAIDPAAGAPGADPSGADPAAGGVPDADPSNPASDTGGAGAPGATTAATATWANVTFTRPIGDGDQGDDVLALQQRLNELHFDVRKPDGYWGISTKMAVWSYQQLVLRTARADVTGKVTPELWEQMKQPLALKPWRPSATATHLEVFLPEQTAVLWVDGQVRLITHISSGSGEEWCAIPRNVPAYVGATTTAPPSGRMRRVCGQSVTPGGTFKVYRKEAGWWDIPLGKVYNPMYFNGGIAIHGYDQVPFTPASHGCVRVPMHIAEYLQQLLHYGDDVFVFDGVQPPESYGAQKSPPDKVDPTDDGKGAVPPTAKPSGPTSTRVQLTPDDQAQPA